MANPQSTAPVLILLVGTSGSHPLSPSIGSGDSVTTPAERGVTPWSVADVARTALAWEGSSGRPLTHSPLYRLCNLNVQLAAAGLSV